MRSGLRIIGAVRTDAGPVRGRNEDNFWLDGETLDTGAGARVICGVPMRPPFAAAVCDGLGGSADGEFCAKHTAELLRRHERALFNPKGRLVPASVFRFIQEANHEICLHMDDIGEHCGTTLAMLAFEKNRAYSINAGDSRSYLLRGGGLRLLSVDDVENQAGNRAHPPRMTQCIGIPERDFRITPHISRRIRLKRNDRFLLCSDGVHGVLDDKRILALLSYPQSPGGAVSGIVKAAFEIGGRDNITALALFVL